MECLIGALAHGPMDLWPPGGGTGEKNPDDSQGPDCAWMRACGRPQALSAGRAKKAVTRPGRRAVCADPAKAGTVFDGCGHGPTRAAAPAGVRWHGAAGEKIHLTSGGDWRENR